MKICHMTSVHPSNDVRIFIKECVTLAAAGHDVYLIAFGDSREEDGVHVIGLGKAPQGRLKRMTKAAKLVYETAKDLDCDVYHFHDPELLPYGVKLHKQGKKAIFDSHEDVPAQILDKGWIPMPLRRLISTVYRAYETSVVRWLDAVVVATPYIEKQFQGRTKRIENINNYPKLDDIVFHDSPFSEREAIACYAGGISRSRGIQTMIDMMEHVDCKLLLAGRILKKDKMPDSVPDKVTYLGLVGREEINILYGKSYVGLVVLMPTPNYVNSLPIKMFEYMAAGLPFVASDFPLWQQIVDENQCGICVDATSPEKVAEVIEHLLNNPEEAQQMGRNGRKAVMEKYNWNVEGKKLIALYEELWAN